MKGPKGPEEADVILGRRLKSLRLRRGLSQSALGKVLGVSFQQIQKFERGAHRMRVSQLWRAAEGLGAPVTELLGITRTDINEISDMVDTPMARRLMEAFQGLTSGERRCLAALADSTCDMNDSISSVMERMTKGKFRHMPVLDNGRLAGLVSIGDAVKWQIERIREHLHQLELTITELNLMKL